MVLRKFQGYNQTNPADDSLRDRILYVEDEDANWSVTELHLRGKYKLDRARNSQEAFKCLHEQDYDLILLDIQLAGSKYDGIEICKILKRLPDVEVPPEASELRYEQVPVVFVTAYAERYSKEMLMQAGGDDVITKPVDFTRLRLVSSRLLVRGSVH